MEKFKAKNNNLIALSFDVEDWFTVRNMRHLIKQTDWDKQDLRIQIGLNFILSELAKRNIKATFFILGWIAHKCPTIIKEIDYAGHEICSHGYSHTPIDLLNPTSFASDLKQSLDIIEQITQKKIRGFRAPSFSITKKTFWAIDILTEHKIEYDSSIFSITHPDYGINHFPKNIVRLRGLLEVPLTKGDFFQFSIPICGGGYFRMLPYWIIKSTIIQTLEKNSFVMYFHPWEFDPLQPKIELSTIKKFRHYTGLNNNHKKFSALLDDFEFTTIANLIGKKTYSDWKDIPAAISIMLFLFLFKQ